MASDVVEFQIQTLLNSVEEVTPKLPLTLSKEFDQIRKCMEDSNLVNKNVWSHSAALVSASSSLIPLLNDLNDALAECSLYAEQSQNVSQGLSTCHYYPFHQTFSVRKMKQNLKSNKHKLVQKISELRISSMPLFPTTRYTSFESNPDFQLLGFDEQEKEIRDLISEISYNAIGVYGMAGSGKTALILKVLNNPSVRNQFSPIIWLCLSDIHSKQDAEYEVNIIKFILCELGCDVDKWTVTNPTKADLLKHLKKLLVSNKYLIVFDDVWENHQFYSNLGDALPLPLPLPGSDVVLKNNRLSEALPRDSGGKIIITSRQKEVGKSMVGENNLICMKPLRRETCRTILEDEIGLTGWVKKIEGWLNGSGFVSIGVYGPSSSANIAVVRKVLSTPSVREKFQHIIWVPVSLIFLNHHQIHPGDEMMKHVLKELGCDDEEVTKNKSGLKLREIVNQSLRSKKYMIVLTDVVYNNYNFWRLISSSWPKDGDGTILVTSKIKELTEYLVGDENLVHVRLPKSRSDEGSEVAIIDHQCCHLPYPAKMIFEYEILEYAKEIEGWLNGSGFVSIGIYGPSSSATTAVVRRVLSNPGIREKFEPIIWVPVSLILLNYDQINNASNVGDGVWPEFMNGGDEIIKHVLKELGFDDELTRNKREYELIKIVIESLRSRNYLIVLSEVELAHYDLQRMMFSIWPTDGDGTLIRTSKMKEMILNSKHLVHVRLPELECNEGISEVVTDGDYISDNIVDQCGGLPFAAKTLANIILENSLHT